LGSGGGGGGSGGFCIQFDSAGYISSYIDGVPGGGGGGGGCGGNGGPGGLQGGTSMALLVKDMAADALVNGNGWVAAPGGNGAPGGKGGVGGAGGSGGARGNGMSTNVHGAYTARCPAPSGAGGDGGRGGAGSGGAGGNGGASIAIALTGRAVAPTATAGVYLGPPGFAGEGGSGGAGTRCQAPSGEAGFGGAAGRVVNVDALPQNVISAGETLAPGESRTSQNGVYRLTLQTDKNLCFYQNGRFQWCSLQSESAQGALVQMQHDGNFCLQNEDRSRTWCASQKTVYPGTYLTVGDDGTVALRYGTETLRTLP
jgi:hypothetical protein